MNGDSEATAPKADEGAEPPKKRYGLRQIMHDDARGPQGHRDRQVHAPLGLDTDVERQRDKLAYNLGRTWSAKGWPVEANPYSALSHPVEHTGFIRGWERWSPHWERQGVMMRDRTELDRTEKFAIQRYISQYARRVPSPMLQPPSNQRRK